MRFEGAEFQRIEPETSLPGHSNYLIGNDRTQWRTNIPHFAKYAIARFIPGIDLVYYGNEGRLEYDFIVAPAQIRRESDFDSKARRP